MNWDQFVIDKPGKAIVNNTTEFDILELPSGKYFLNKEVIITKEVLTKLKNYTPEGLKKDSEYPIYVLVGSYIENDKTGTTTRLTDVKRLNKIIQEIEESLIKQ